MTDMIRQPDIWQRTDTNLTQPVSIKLERGQKGGYGWEIKVYSETGIDALAAIKLIDTNLRNTYINEGGSNEKQTA